MSLHLLEYVGYDGPINLSGQALKIALNNLRFTLRYTKTKIVLFFMWAINPVYLFVDIYFSYLDKYITADSDGVYKLKVLTQKSLDSLLDIFTSFSLVQLVSLFVFYAIVGANVISDDNRDNVIQFLLSRPLTIMDYIGGKYLYLLLLGCGVTLFPTMIAMLGLALGSIAAPVWGELVLHAIGYCASSLVITAIVAAVMLGIGSLSKLRSTVRLLWFFCSIYVVSNYWVDYIPGYLEQMWRIKRVIQVIDLFIYGSFFHLRAHLSNVVGGFQNYGGNLRFFSDSDYIACSVWWTLFVLLAIAGAGIGLAYFRVKKLSK